MRTNIDKKIARLQFQAEDMLNEQQRINTEREENKKQKDANAIIEESFMDRGSYFHNKRVKEMENNRKFNYANQFTSFAVTEAMTQYVKDALLLNLDEYAKLNPNYETEIRNTIKTFVDGSAVNESIDSPLMQALFEEIKNNMPSAESYLTEEEERRIVITKIMPSSVIKDKLDGFIGDVRARVANIVSKDQETLAAEKRDLDYINDKELEKAPIAPVQNDPPADNMDMPMDDPEMQNGDQVMANPPEEQDQQQPQQEPEQAPVQEGFIFTKESKKRGIVETLALNEASNMIANGGEYNKTLALANAIKYITVLEAMDASGIVDVGTEGYNKILSASGADMNPVSKTNIPGDTIVDKPVVNSVADTTEIKPEPVYIPDESKQEKEVRSKISDLFKDAIPSNFAIGNENRVFQPFADWKKQNPSFGNSLSDLPERVNEEVTYKGVKGDILTESQLRTKFEKEGFDLDYVSFDELATGWNYVKQPKK